MKRLAGLVLIVLAIVAAALGLYVSAANRDVLVLDLLFWPAVEARAGLVLVLAFVAGALCALVAATLAGLGDRIGRDLRRARDTAP